MSSRFPQPRLLPPARARRARHRRTEGVVMLVVMMMLLLGTAGATIALDASRNGLRAAGHNRTAFQTKYMAESILVNAMAYIDNISTERLLLEQQAQVLAPNMDRFGEPAIMVDTPLGIATGRHHAMRLYDSMLCANAMQDEEPAVQVPASLGMHPSGGCPTDSADLTGTMGFGNAWQPNRFVADITDCQEVTTLLPGEAQSTDSVRLRCVLTARGRTAVRGVATREWTYGAAQAYQQPTHQAAHDGRAVIMTPAFTGGKGNGQK